MAIHVNENVVLKTVPLEEVWKVIEITPRTPKFVTI